MYCIMSVVGMGLCGGGGWIFVMKMNGIKVIYLNKEMIFVDEL